MARVTWAARRGSCRRCYIHGEFPVEDFLDLLGGGLVERSAGTLAEAAEINGEDVEAGGSEEFGEVVPDFALAIALVEKKHAGAGLGGGEEGGFEAGAVRRGEIYAARGRRLLGGDGEGDQEKRQDAAKRSDAWNLRGDSLQFAVISL